MYKCPKCLLVPLFTKLNGRTCSLLPLTWTEPRFYSQHISRSPIHFSSMIQMERPDPSKSLKCMPGFKQVIPLIYFRVDLLTWSCNKAVENETHWILVGMLFCFKLCMRLSILLDWAYVAAQDERVWQNVAGLYLLMKPWKSKLNTLFCNHFISCINYALNLNNQGFIPGPGHLVRFPELLSCAHQVAAYLLIIFNG